MGFQVEPPLVNARHVPGNVEHYPFAMWSTPRIAPKSQVRCGVTGLGWGLRERSTTGATCCHCFARRPDDRRSHYVGSPRARTPVALPWLWTRRTVPVRGLSKMWSTTPSECGALRGRRDSCRSGVVAKTPPVACWRVRSRRVGQLDLSALGSARSPAHRRARHRARRCRHCW